MHTRINLINSLSGADIILKVRQPSENEVSLFKKNGTLISFMYPAQNKNLIEKLAEKQMTVFGKLHQIMTFMT